MVRKMVKKVKSKSLKLKPSARDKRRYFLVGGGKQEVEKAILRGLGVIGLARAAYMYVKKKDSKIVGSCFRAHLEDVRAALALEGMRIEKVGGTLRGLGVS